MPAETTPESVTQDLAEKAARVWWERATGEPWSLEAAESLQGWQRLVVTAYEWIDTMRAAGLEVVALPGAADERRNEISGMRSAMFGPVRARFLHLTDLQDHSLSEIDWSLGYGGTGWVDADRTAATAAGLLAGLAWVEQLTAECQDGEPHA